MTQVIIETNSDSNSARLEAASEYLAQNPDMELVDWSGHGQEAILMVRSKDN